MKNASIFESSPDPNFNTSVVPLPQITTLGSSSLERCIGGKLSAYAYLEATSSSRPAEGTLDDLSPDDGECVNIKDPEVAHAIEVNGFVRPAPRFVDQVADTTRTTKFKTMNGKTLTEHKGLVQLAKLLTKNDQLLGEERLRSSDGRPQNVASSMLKNLTFIGAPEFEEGAAGIADYWKSYLSGDVGRNICVLAEVSGNYRQKSDRYLFDEIMRHFDDDELGYFAGSIITDKDKLRSDPLSTRVVLLDDWTISGEQLHRVYENLRQTDVFDEYAKGIEANVLAASRARLNYGLGLEYTKVDVPVKAYWLAHSAEGYSRFPNINDAFISGLHSSVDYDFRDPLYNMPKPRNDTPKIADIKSAYRSKDLTNLDRLDASLLRTAHTEKT